MYSIYEYLAFVNMNEFLERNNLLLRSFLPGFKSIFSLAYFWLSQSFPAQPVSHKMQASEDHVKSQVRGATAAHRFPQLFYVFLLKKCLLLIERNNWHFLYCMATHRRPTNLKQNFICCTSWRLSLFHGELWTSGRPENRVLYWQNMDTLEAFQSCWGKKLIMNSLKFISICPGET